MSRLRYVLLILAIAPAVSAGLWTRQAAASSAFDKGRIQLADKDEQSSRSYEHRKYRESSPALQDRGYYQDRDLDRYHYEGDLSNRGDFDRDVDRNRVDRDRDMGRDRGRPFRGPHD